MEKEVKILTEFQKKNQGDILGLVRLFYPNIDPEIISKHLPKDNSHEID